MQPACADELIFARGAQAGLAACKTLASKQVRFYAPLLPNRGLSSLPSAPVSTRASRRTRSGPREQTQAREQKPRQTADRSPARRGDVSDEHDASRPASLTFISPRIFGKREGTAHNIRALPRRARARRASAASPQRPARRLRRRATRRAPARTQSDTLRLPPNEQDDGRPPLAFVLSS